MSISFIVSFPSMRIGYVPASVPLPTASRGRFLRIKYITQLKGRTPQFVFFCNLPKDVKDSYKRFLENKLRETWDFNGVPIQLIFKEK